MILLELVGGTFRNVWFGMFGYGFAKQDGLMITVSFSLALIFTIIEAYAISKKI